MLCSLVMLEFLFHAVVISRPQLVVNSAIKTQALFLVATIALPITNEVRRQSSSTCKQGKRSAFQARKCTTQKEPQK